MICDIQLVEIDDKEKPMWDEDDVCFVRRKSHAWAGCAFLEFGI